MSDEVHEAGLMLASQGKLSFDLALDLLIHFALPGLGYFTLPGAKN
jgi:hypothetical protein